MQINVVENANECEFMRMAILMADNGINNNEGGPFGAIIVKNGEIVGKGNNKVTSTNDPTAHAEVIAIREACKNLNTYDLNGCEIYASCEPCPMCLSAIYWSNIGKIYYANTKNDAANIGFRDQFIYEEFDKPVEKRSKPTIQILRDEAINTFKAWLLKEDKKEY